LLSRPCLCPDRSKGGREGGREGGRDGGRKGYVLVAVVLPALEFGYRRVVLVQALLQEEAVETLARL